MSSSIVSPFAPSFAPAPTRRGGQSPVGGPATTVAAALRAHPTGRRRAKAEQRSDETLLAQAHAGDAAAFGVVYDRHAAAAYSLAYRLVHSRSTAQDVVQESFLALWRTDTYRADKGSVRSFILGIVRNRAIDALRKNRRRTTEERSDEAAVASLPAADRTDAEVEQREAQRLLRAAIASLPEPQQRALELAFFEGLTHAEIALRLNAPIGTIKGRIRMGLQRLRAEVDGASDR